MVSFKKITSSVICGKTKAINAVRLDKPIEYNGNPNPFEKKILNFKIPTNGE